METNEILVVWEVAEQLCNTGKPLQAFLALCSLLLYGKGEGGEAVDSAALARTAFPPYLKVEELVTRVRAAECLLLDDPASATSGSAVTSASHHVQLSRLATQEKLELAQLVLAPLFALSSSTSIPARSATDSVEVFGLSPSGALRTTASRGQLKLQGNEYFFHTASVVGLVWPSTPFTMVIPSEDGAATVDRDNPNSISFEVPEERKVACFSALRSTPLVSIALVVKAYTLQARLEGKRQHYRRALQYLRAAEEWVHGVFGTAPPSLTGPPSSAYGSKGALNAELDRSFRCLLEGLSHRLIPFEDSEKGMGSTPNLAAVHAALRGLLRHEHASCQAALTAEECFVRHQSILACAREISLQHQHRLSSLPSATAASSPLVDLKASYKEYSEGVRELAGRSAVYATLARVLALRRHPRTTCHTTAPLQTVSHALHPACFSALHDKKSVREYNGMAAVQVVGFYHCVAASLLAAAPHVMPQGYYTVDALEHVSTCAGLFQSNNSTSPASEFPLLRQLLLVGYAEDLSGMSAAADSGSPKAKAPLVKNEGYSAGEGEVGFGRKRARCDEDDGMVSENANDGTWTTPGVRRALSSYLVLYQLTQTTAPSQLSGVKQEEGNAETHSGADGTGGRQPPQIHLVAAAERQLALLLEVVDAEMLALTHYGGDGSSSDTQSTTIRKSVQLVDTPSIAGAMAADSKAGEPTEAAECRQQHYRVLRASTFSQVRLLVQIKASALLTISAYCLTQLNVVRAVHHVATLQAFMRVFRRHTEPLLVEVHLVIACLCMALSLRDGTQYDMASNGSLSQAPSSTDGFDLVSHDVGLPYWHLEAAARLSAFLAHTHSAAWLRIQLFKALAVYQVVADGNRLVISSGVQFPVNEGISNGPWHDDGGADRRSNSGSASAAAARASAASASVSLEQVPQTQRHRCGAALARMMEELVASYDAHHSGDSAVPRGNGSGTRGSAWTTSNVVLFRLLQGLVALTEDKDEPTAIRAFKSATQLAKRRVGMLSPYTADGLQLLSCARRQYEGGAHSTAASSSPTDGVTTSEYQKAAAVALQVAMRTSCSALLHLQDTLSADDEDVGVEGLESGGAKAMRSHDAPSMHRWWELQMNLLCHQSSSNFELEAAWREAGCTPDSLRGVGYSELLGVVSLLPGTPGYAKFSVA